MENSVKNEIFALRDRFCKHYDLGHGRRQAVLFPQAVHFKRGGAWQEIDNSLIETEYEGRRIWRNRDNPLKAMFAQDGGAPTPVRIEYEGHSVEWGFVHGAAQAAEAQMAAAVHSAQAVLPEKLYAGVRYEGICPGIEARYTLEGLSCKEDIVVESRAALADVSIWMRSNDLRFAETAEGAVEARFAGRPIFRFAPPMASDSAGLTDVPVPIRLTETEDGVRLDYLPDEAFVQAAVFPIVIDPSVEVVNETSNLDDTYLCSNHPTTNYNTKTYIEIGWQDSVPNENVALVRFKNLIPLTAGDTVTKAELSFAVKQTTDYAKNPKYVGLYEVKRDWDAASVTWNSFNPNDSANIDTAVQDCIIRTDRTRVLFDITNLYRSWYHRDASGQAHNFGIALRRPVLKSNTVWNYTQFYTRNRNASSAPKLTVTYVSHAGLEKRWDYESLSAGRAGTVYAGVFNGNGVAVHPDLAMTGLRQPIAVSHYYNSCACNDDSCHAGSGWRTSLHQSLHSETIEEKSYYVWTDGDGTAHYFPITGSAPYADEDGLNLKLTYTAASATITDLMDNVMTFEKPSGWSRYWLTKTGDCLDNGIALSYLGEGKIDRATDPTGRYVQFSYGADGRLSRVQAFTAAGTDAGYPHCTYAYDGAGNLTGVGYSDISGGTSYSYDHHLLTGLNNYDGRSVTVGYEAASDYDGTLFSGDGVYPALRLKALEEKAGVQGGVRLTFDYRHMSTHVTSVSGTGQDRTLIYQFSDHGNVVSVRDELGYAAYAAYGEELPNHAERTSKLQRTVVNLLKNHSFETESDWTATLEDGAAGTHSYAGDQKKLGSKSAKMARTNAAGAMRIAQTVSVVSGRTYTLSCFARTDTAGVKCQARAVCGGTVDGLAIESVGTWSRVSVTFTAAASSATVSFAALGAAGSAWFDCAQIEEGETANRYNMLENGCFDRGLESWTAKSENDEGDAVIACTDALHPAYLGGNVLQLTGYPNKNKGNSQEIKASGAQGDVFVAGGWAKGRSRPVQGEKKRFCMRLEFYVSSAWTDGGYVDWNEEWTDWQYATGMVKAPGAYTKIRYSIDYEKNVNEAMFDGLALYREAYGEEYNYNANGTLRNVRTKAGNQDIRLYDANNNFAQYAAPGAGTEHSRRMHYGFDDDARKKHLMRYQNSPMLVQDVYAYDTYGNRTAHKRQDTNNQTAIRSTSAYTADGDRLESRTDPRGNTVRYAYNANGTVSQTTLPNGQSVSYGYDASGRVTGTQAATAAGTHKSAYAYANDRLTQVRHNTTGDAMDVSYSFDYDAFGKPTTVKVGSQLLSENIYETNRHQQLKQVNYGNGQSVENRYDEHGRLTGKKFGTDTAWRWEYAYAANGTIARLKDNGLNRVIWTDYDTANRPETTTIQDTSGNLLYRTTLSYDDLEHVGSQQENVAGTNYATSYTYDWDDRATEIRYGDSAHRVRYGYDGQGRLQTRRVTNGNADQTSTYSYLGSSVAIPGLSTVSSTNLVSGISQPLVSFAYGYAGDTDNIVSETRTGGSYAGTTTYEYDSLGQLIRVNDSAEGTTRVYRYDLGGNMTGQTKYAYTTGTPGEAQETIAYSYADANWKDKLTGSTISAIGEYDAIGNLLEYNGWVYEWEAGRQLKRQVQNGETDVRYEYDQNGMRVRKTVNGAATNYTYNGTRLVHLTTGGDSLHFYYDGQGKPALVSHNGVTYSYLYNLQGDVIGLVDNAGNLVVEYKYNAWGSIIGRAGSLSETLGKLNPFRYRGYVYDEETWMYWLKSRYYYPELSRFISADDTAQLCAYDDFTSTNLYAYCGNNPIAHEDMGGTYWLSSFLLGVATQYVADVVQNVISGSKGWDILKPSSTVGEYLAAGVTAMIPGSGLGAAVVRNVVAEGIVCTEKIVNGEEIDVAKSVMRVGLGVCLDLGFEAVTDRIVHKIENSIPQNYSGFAHYVRQTNPNLSRQQIYPIMRRSLRMNHVFCKAVEYTIGVIETTMSPDILLDEIC